MIVASGQSVTTLFTTNDADGASADADSTPTGTLYVNGTANGASVTVTNIATGEYKAAVTLPALSAGDIVSIRVAATIDTIASKAKVWEAVCTPTTSVSDKTGFSLSSTGLDAIVPAEPAGEVQFGTSTLPQHIAVQSVPITNKKTFNKDTGITTYRNNADNASLWTTTATDDGTTRTIGKAT